MKKTTLGLLIVLMSVQWTLAQNSPVEQEIIDLSKNKWQWMSDKNVDALADDRQGGIEVSRAHLSVEEGLGLITELPDRAGKRTSSNIYIGTKEHPRLQGFDGGLSWLLFGKLSLLFFI